MWFCSFCFTVLFGLGASFLWSKGLVDPEAAQLRWLPYLCAIGLLDALNGVLVVYSSPLSRTPGPLQSVLQLATAPLTMFFSRIMLTSLQHDGAETRRTYTLRQYLAVLVVLVGSVVGIIPAFKAVESGEATLKVDKFWWPLVFMAGMFPGVAMNVIMEKLYRRATAKHMSVFFVQAVESFFQLMWMSCFFFFDIFPNYGSSENVEDFGRNFRGGFECFFSRCKYTWWVGGIFIISYMMSYIFGTFMTLFFTANLQAVAGTLPPPIAMVVWFAFPDYTNWADGSYYPVHSLAGALNVSAALIIVCGIVWYRAEERGSKTDSEVSDDELRYFPLH